MAIIGVIDIAMRATTEKFTSGIKSAQGQLKSFTGGLSSAYGVYGKFAAAIGTAAAAIGATALVSNSLKNLNEVGELADRLGVGAQDLAKFTYAVQLTDGPVEDLSAILGKLNATLGDAAKAPTGPVATALRQLGLNAQELAKAGPVEAMKQIGQRLQQIENPAARAAMATEFFGKKAASLMSTLNATSGTIRDLENDALRLNLAPKDADIGKIQEANDALERSQKTVEGFGNAIVVKLAPYLKLAADNFTEFGTKGEGATGMVADGIGFASTAMGYLVDGVQWLALGFKLTQTVVTAALTVLVKGLGLAGRAIQAVVNLIPGMNATFGDTVDAMGNALAELTAKQAKEAGAWFSQPWNSSKMTDAFDKVAQSADKAGESIAGAGKKTKGASEVMSDTVFAVSELEKKLKDQITTVGFTAEGLEVYKLQQAGATAADVKRLLALANQVHALEENKKAMEKLEDEAKKVTEDTRTVSEKAKVEKAKLKELFSKGLIDKETLTRGIQKVNQESGALDVGKRAGAVEQGSQEARTTLLNLRQGGTPAEQAQKNTATATAETAKGVNELVKQGRTLYRTPQELLHI